MTIWSGEINDLNKVYSSFKGNLPDIMKEIEQLIKTDDPNVVMLYARRCLEVIVTDLCECELKRPRKTEPLKGIIDKLNSEEKIPSYIGTSMLSLNSMANYGAHPKDFDPEQVKPVLNNLNIIIKWYLKYKDFKVVSKTDTEEAKLEKKAQEPLINPTEKPKKRSSLLIVALIVVIVVLAGAVGLHFLTSGKNNISYDPDMRENSNYIVDSRDDQEYRTVAIGSQVWMAENLKAVKFSDGTPIPLVKNSAAWQKLETPGYCWYNNDKRVNKEAYGALYNWYAVNTGKLCPVGWHVPSTAEWTKLTRFVGDSINWILRGDTVPLPEVAGKILKQAGNAHWSYLDTITATDQYGFRALPGGERTIYGLFWGIREEGSWWSFTQSDIDTRDAYNREMYYNQNGVTDIEQYKQFGLSVRCVKN
ncbi:MAG: FISUMP domain-containing protein [Bacteroidales bacterium]